MRPANGQLWSVADSRFERLEAEQGQWTLHGDSPKTWTVTCNLPGLTDRVSGSGLDAAVAAAGMTFALKQTDFGHVGLFPEQAENWDWIVEQVRRCHADSAGALKVLNLFAYTGGSTLAAAAAGAHVTHVDAARNIVAWARQNAELSALCAAPIRWIAEDALKFVTREIRRGNRYDAIILDPPSYGHGTRGEVWRLAEDLPRLLGLCAELTKPRPRFVLLSCHTAGFTAASLRELLVAAFGPPRTDLEARPLWLASTSGQKLSSGIVARWSDG